MPITPRKLIAFSPISSFVRSHGSCCRRNWHTLRFWRDYVGAATLQPVSDGIVRVPGAPPGLSPLPARCLTFRSAACALTLPSPRVRIKPPAVNRAGAFAGRGHRDPSSACPEVLRSPGQGHFGEYHWLISATAEEMDDADSQTAGIAGLFHRAVAEPHFGLEPS